MEIYKDPSAPAESRVKDLISRMTLEEKIGQMTLIGRGSIKELHEISSGRFGGVNMGKGPTPEVMDWADKTDEFQRAALKSRLGIPLFVAVDAVHGHNFVYGTTIFPHNIGLGATRDVKLIERIGAATALECQATGVNYTFAPCVAVVKDVRWRRSYESYGEDTKIVEDMTSIIKGLQGQPPPEHAKDHPFAAGRNNVIACAKHFVGDGGTKEGTNAGNTESTDEESERIHMDPYVACISNNVSTIMASYSCWNGQRMHSNHSLLTVKLKNELGFKGLVISDWKGIERLDNPTEPNGSSYLTCAPLAINAGIDMVMGPISYKKFQEDLTTLVNEGVVPLDRIDDAVERILRVKFAAGIFEHPLSNRSLINQVGCELHREIAREAVRKSMVLLKNGKDPKKPFLPLYKNAKKILVAGTHADDLGYQVGGWTIGLVGGSGRITDGTTILEAIKHMVGAETEVTYEQSPTEDTFSAHDFAFSIVAIGETPYLEFLGADKDLKDHLDGADLISLIADRVPTLVILISGRPLVIEPILEKVDALVAAWLPGTEGTGIADVLFGDYDFQGRLPVSWFKRLDQLPMDAKADSYDPLFPLGFGLTCKKKD